MLLTYIYWAAVMSITVDCDNIFIHQNIHL